MRQARPGDKISITIEGTVLPFPEGDKNVGHGLEITGTSGADYYLYVKDANQGRTHLLWVHTAGKDCTYPPYKITDSKYRMGDTWRAGTSFFVCIMRNAGLVLVNTATGNEISDESFTQLRPNATLVFRPRS
jgi:hypothetical protein